MTAPPLRIVVADDEWAAREELGFILEPLDDVDVVAAVGDGAAALEAIERLRPDVAILDIKMPPPDGIAVARELVQRGSPPALIFATAYSEFAVSAYDVAAVDYVLKPYEEARVLRAIGRARAVVWLRRRPPLVVRRRRKTHFLPLDAVVWIGTQSGVVTVCDQGGVHYGCDETLRDLSHRLEPIGFYRCHREAIIQLQRIASIEPGPSGTYTVMMDEPGSTRLPVARNRVGGLKAALGLKS